MFLAVPNSAVVGVKIHGHGHSRGKKQYQQQPKAQASHDNRIDAQACQRHRRLLKIPQKRLNSVIVSAIQISSGPFQLPLALVALELPKVLPYCCPEKR